MKYVIRKHGTQWKLLLGVAMLTFDSYGEARGYLWDLLNAGSESGPFVAIHAGQPLGGTLWDLRN